MLRREGKGRQGGLVGLEHYDSGYHSSKHYQWLYPYESDITAHLARNIISVMKTPS